MLQETLIVWSEGENCDLALSFQEKAACDEIWEKICGVQGKDPSVEVTQDVSYGEESDEGEAEGAGFAGVAAAAAGLALPPPDVSRLGEVLETILGALPSPIKRESLALALESSKYIAKLVELFKMCEDVEDLDSLHILYQIIKNIFLLNKNALFEVPSPSPHLTLPHTDSPGLAVGVGGGVLGGAPGGGGGDAGVRPGGAADRRRPPRRPRHQAPGLPLQDGRLQGGHPTTQQGAPRQDTPDLPVPPFPALCLPQRGKERAVSLQGAVHSGGHPSGPLHLRREHAVLPLLLHLLQQSGDRLAHSGSPSPSPRAGSG